MGEEPRAPLAAAEHQTILDASRRSLDTQGGRAYPPTIMTAPKILAAATATPPHFFPQERLAGLAGYADRKRAGFFANSAIEGRYLYLDPHHPRTDESVDELNERFRQGALELGEAAARRCLTRAGWEIRDVDFLATTTCTGRLCPSLVGVDGRSGDRLVG